MIGTHVSVCNCIWACARNAWVKWDIWMKNQTLCYLWLSITYKSVVFQEYIPTPKKITIQGEQPLAIFNWIEQLFGCNIVHSVRCNFALKHKCTTSAAHLHNLTADLIKTKLNQSLFPWFSTMNTVSCVTSKHVGRNKFLQKQETMLRVSNCNSFILASDLNLLHVRVTWKCC